SRELTRMDTNEGVGIAGIATGSKSTHCRLREFPEPVSRGMLSRDLSTPRPSASGPAAFSRRCARDDRGRQDCRDDAGGRSKNRHDPATNLVPANSAVLLNHL